LDFPDKTFDRCYADRVFPLLGKRQAEALAELVRVCKPGGRIVICSPDTRTFTLDIGEREVTSRVLAFIAARGWQGGEAANLMREAGLELLEVDIVSSFETDFEAIDRSTPIRSLGEWAVRGGAISEGDFDAWATALEKAVATDRFSFSSGIVIASARKPQVG
jgi:hypothetical protein